MDDTDRKILQALSFKKAVSFGGLAGEMAEGIIEDHLRESSVLVERDYVRVERPIGNPQFVHITEKGRRALWGWRKRMINGLMDNWVNILSLVLTAVLLGITIIVTIRDWK